jgi:CDP-diglyceride synthetase
MRWGGCEMTKLGAFVAACAIVVALAFAASWGVERLMLLMVHHPLPKWVAGATGSFTAIVTATFGAFIASAGDRKSKKKEDGRLTPIVRRDARTGLRQL